MSETAFTPGPYSLQVCRFPGQYQEHPRSSGWVIGLMEAIWKDHTIGKVQPYTVSDTPITMARNRAVKNALDCGIDYILMIDADMDPDFYVGMTRLQSSDPWDVPFFPTAWTFMMDRRRQEERYWRELVRNRYQYTTTSVSDATWAHHRKDSIAEIDDAMFSVFPPATIAAPYCGPPPEENCFVFEWKSQESDHPNPDFKLGMIAREKAAILSGIQEVAALPTGLVLYDARVFRKLPPPWFAYEWEDEHQTRKATTEDVYQTRNASLLGMPQFIAWDCWAGHVKLKTVGKPRIITPDMVIDKLREGLKNVRSDQRLRFIREGA